MSNQLKNPNFISLIAVLVGIALGAWGWTKSECNSSPDCFHGSGALMWSGGILLGLGLLGWFIFGNGKKRP